MLASQIPAKVPLPFANSGTKNAIPTASQIGITAGAASLTDGFPPLTFTPLASGGVPPAGADFNGILNLVTAVQQWQSAGGQFKYDSAFSTLIGGYPAGAILTSTSNTVSWLNLVDNNTTDPDSGAAANWSPVDAYGATTIALTNANVTLTSTQFSKSIIVLTGALTGNVQLTHPKLIGDWYFINSTTGAFTVQLLTSGGSPIILSQGSASTVRGDGANVFIDALQVGTATQPAHAVQFGQLTGVVGAIRNAKMSVTAASANATFSADEIVVESALGGLQYRLSNYSQVINLATTGAGGMDTGTAPVSGFVSLYAIYNPTSNTKSILACAQATSNGSVYSGANMPVGYTASALIGSWQTNPSSQFPIGYQIDRTVFVIANSALSTNTQQAAYTSLSLSTIVPSNAKSAQGHYSLGSTNVTNVTGQIGSSAAGLAAFGIAAGIPSVGQAISGPFPMIPLITAQTLFYTCAVGAGTMTFAVAISAWTF